MSFLALLILDISGSLEKLEFGALSSPATPKETVSARGSSSCSWLPVRQIWPDFPKLETHNRY